MVSSDCHLSRFPRSALNLEQEGGRSEGAEERGGERGHGGDIIVTNSIGNLILVFILDSTIPMCSIRLCVCVETWQEWNRKGTGVSAVR